MISSEQIKVSKNILVVYHDNCIDGFTSYWVINRFLKQRFNNIFGCAASYTKDDYIKIETEIGSKDIDFVYIVDFSVPMDVLKRITDREQIKKVVILDHHKTAIEHYFPEFSSLGNIQMCTLDTEKIFLMYNLYMSGAGLAWVYWTNSHSFHPLVLYVQDYDLWRFDQGVTTHHVNEYLQSRPKTLEEWERIAAMLEGPDEPKLMEEGKFLYRAFKLKAYEIAKRATPITLEGVKGLQVECPRKYSNLVGEELARKSETFGLTYAVKGEKVKYSIRTLPQYNLDVAEIAKPFGGGGHKTAAGFIMNNNTGKEDTADE